MALNIENDSVQSAPESFTNNTAAPSAPAAVRPTLGSVFAPLGAISAAPGHANAIVLREEVTELLKTEAKEYVFQAHDLPTCADLSGFILSAYLEGKKDMVSYIVVMLDGTHRNGESERSAQVRLSNLQTIEVRMLPSDYANDTLRDAARNMMINLFSNGQVIYAGQVVVPKSFDVKDKAAIRTLTEPVSGALVQELALKQDRYTPINLTNLGIKNGLVVEQIYNPQMLNSADGMPIRSDAIIEMSYNAKSSSQQNAMPNSADSVMTLSRVSTFMEVLYYPMAPKANAWMLANGPRDTRSFKPRIVITDILLPTRTPERLALALATVFTMSDNNHQHWLSMFKPSGSRSDLRNKLRNVGVLNFEANIGNDESGIGDIPAPANGVEYSLMEIGQILKATMDMQPAYAIDVPDAGPNTSYLQILSDIAKGDQAAYKEFYAAMNVLTGGKLEHFFPYGKPIFNQAATDRYFVGQCGDGQGGKSDIRIFDYITAANVLGRNNIDLLREFSNTMTDINLDTRIRMEKQRGMLDSLAQGTASFHGRGLRCTFSTDFVVGFSQAIAATGIPVEVKTPMSSGEFGSNQVGATWMDGSTVNWNGSAFARGSVSSGNGFGNMGGFSGRFG